jgi:t-SNARE complex subunit (syntaxin)
MMPTWDEPKAPLRLHSLKILEETHICQQQLRDIMARHNELEKLEKSLIEVRDLFVRMATLVFEQGALIQVVEYHAQQTVSNVDRAEKTLEKARDLKIKALKVSLRA